MPRFQVGIRTSILSIFFLVVIAQAAKEDTASTLDPIRYQLLLDANWGHRTGEIYDDGNPIARQYLEELLDGFSFGVTAGGYISDRYGLGLNINRFATSHSDPRISITVGPGGSLPPGTILNGISDNIVMWFVGPVFLEKHEFLDRKFLLLIELGAGYLGYSNDGKVGTESLDITASTASVLGSVKIAMRNPSGGIFGIQARFLGGSFQKQTVNGVEMELPEKESISRFDLGIVFGFGR
jgi:hypothetical protein